MSIKLPVLQLNVCGLIWMWRRFTNVLWLQVFDMLIGVMTMMWLLHDDNKVADMSNQLLTSAHVSCRLCCTVVLSCLLLQLEF